MFRATDQVCVYQHKSRKIYHEEFNIKDKVSGKYFPMGKTL